MSFWFRDIISVSRVALPDPTAIDGGYEGLQADEETIIFTGIAADIQITRLNKMPLPDLPADTQYRKTYRIHFRMPVGSINIRDIITDQRNTRYQVTDNYWTNFNYQCDCELLET